MVVDDAEPGTESGDSEQAGGRLTVGRLARVVLALVAVLVGIVWTVRIAIDGSVSSGVLFQLLPSIALVYLGIRYFRSTVGQNRGGSS